MYVSWFNFFYPANNFWVHVFPCYKWWSNLKKHKQIGWKKQHPPWPQLFSSTSCSSSYLLLHLHWTVGTSIKYKWSERVSSQASSHTCMHENSLVSAGREHMKENAFWDYKNKFSWKFELDLVMVWKHWQNLVWLNFSIHHECSCQAISPPLLEFLRVEHRTE